MDDAMKTYLAGKDTRRSNADTARAYSETVAKALPRITLDIREGNKLASQLRVAGAAANRARESKD
jgi:hypothetical protein